MRPLAYPIPARPARWLGLMVAIVLLIGCAPVTPIQPAAETTTATTASPMPSIMPPATNTAPPPLPTPSPMITSTAQGRLTGPFDDAATNRDAGGLYQFLTITFTVEVTQAGGFGVLAALTAGGDNLIALGSLSSDTQRAAPVTNIDLAAGSQRVTAYFEGRALRAAGIPGPYTVQLGLFDEAANALDRAQFATAPYDLAQFQGD